MRAPTKTNLVTSPADVSLAVEAAERVVLVHQRVSAVLKAGMTLAQVDKLVAQALADLQSKSCFLGYRVPRTPPFTSHACLSVNDCIVHGTAGSYTKPLERGDLFSIDIGVSYKGWIGDAAWTYAIGEYPSDEAKRLMDAGKESLHEGVKELHPNNTYKAWAERVEHIVEEKYGFHLTLGLGGHGYGRILHQPPYISNSVPGWMGEWPDGSRQCKPGTLVAVEPMLAIGTGHTKQKRGEWPIYTADGSLSVHYEHDVLITEDGPRVLTQGLENLPDVVG
ncbi:MAG: type I methionyl aminopeptidase [Phycisphaeraceae bacterium]|nr:type I methionyl aminopeptidase [Phycisphaerales bacterium]MCB9861437.1 type I methionyl aminopeptidase [Phycisphaeraceae bacterium]